MNVDYLITKKEYKIIDDIIKDLKYNNYNFLLDYQKYNSSLVRFDFKMKDLKKFENIPEKEYHLENKRYILLNYKFISDHTLEDFCKTDFLFKELDTKTISNNRDVFSNNYIVFVDGKVSLYPTIFCLENQLYLLFDIEKPILPYEEKSNGTDTIDFYTLYNNNVNCTILFIPNANRISGPTQAQDIHKYAGKIPFDYDRYKQIEINTDSRKFKYLTFLSSDNTRGMVLSDVITDKGKFIFDLTRYDRKGRRFLLDSICIPNLIYEKTIPKGTRWFTLNELDMPIHPDNILVFKRDKFGNRLFVHNLKIHITHPNVYTITNYDYSKELSLFILFHSPNMFKTSYYDNFSKKFIEYKSDFMTLATMGLLPKVITEYKEPLIEYNAGDFETSTYTEKIDYMIDTLYTCIKYNADFISRIYNKYNYNTNHHSIFNVCEKDLKRRVRLNDYKEGGKTDFNKKCYCFSIARKEAFKDSLEMLFLINGILIEPDYVLEKISRKYIYVDINKIDNDASIEIILIKGNISTYTERIKTISSYTDIILNNNFNSRFYNMIILDHNDNIIEDDRIELQLLNHDETWMDFDTNNYMTILDNFRFRIKDYNLMYTDINFIINNSIVKDIKYPEGGLNSLSSYESTQYFTKYLNHMYDIYIDGRKIPLHCNYIKNGGYPFEEKTIINAKINRSDTSVVSYIKKSSMYEQLIFIKEIPINGIIDLREIIKIPLNSSNLIFYLNGRKLYDDNIELLSSRIIRLRNVNTIYNFEILEKQVVQNNFSLNRLGFYSDKLYDLYKSDLDENIIIVTEQDMFDVISEKDIEHIDYTDKYINSVMLSNDKFIDCETEFEINDGFINHFTNTVIDEVFIVGDSEPYGHDYVNIL